MNAELNLSFNNSYLVELIDSITGDTKQSGVFHNLVTDNIGAYLVGAISNATEENATGRSRITVEVAVGSGTDTPQQSDTALKSKLWSADANLQNFAWVDDYTAKVEAVVTFPATASYVGSISEVGVYGGQYYKSAYTTTIDSRMLVTKSLLTDSEGQPISFNKTDLDILKITVTIQLSLSSATQDFKLLKKNSFIRLLLTGAWSSNNLFAETYGRLNLCRFHNTVETYNGQSVVTLDQPVEATVKGYRSGRSGRLTYPAARLSATAVTSERYYKAIAIPGLGYWKLPNEDIFPTYEIKNISVGTGDGTTTQFLSPLCYFKKDSDKVYKNGVQLTRGVDYTLNSQGNSKCLQEINEFALPNKVTTAATSVTTLKWAPLFVPSTVNYSPSGTQWFSSANPLYLEYDEPVTLNCFVSSGGWRYINGTNGYGNLPAGSVFYLDSSDDGVTYTEVAQASISEQNGGFDVEFTNTTAKYWRIRTSYSGTIAMVIPSSGDNNYIALNYKDPYITFAEAPADGDIITMDVGMDIIMKNSNFVVDVGAVLNFTW